MSIRTIIAIVISVGVVALLVLVFSFSGGSSAEEGNNIYMKGEAQIVEISARGGYYPGKTIAKANLPTIIRVKTSGTFDCSALLVIPGLNYRQMLQASGSVDISAGTRGIGDTIRGTCGMGMYHFAIYFK